MAMGWRADITHLPPPHKTRKDLIDHFQAAIDRLNIAWRELVSFSAPPEVLPEVISCFAEIRLSAGRAEDAARDAFDEARERRREYAQQVSTFMPEPVAICAGCHRPIYREDENRDKSFTLCNYCMGEVERWVSTAPALISARLAVRRLEGSL